MTAAEMAYSGNFTSTSSAEDLVTQELPQVYYIAARIRDRLPQHVELEDLVGAGVIGLIEASRSFDPSKNAQFKTYAQFRIRGAILDSLREIDWGSRLMRRRGREISDATARLESKLGRTPVESEIAQELQITPDQLHKITAQLDALHISGQQVMRNNDGSEMIDVIESAPSRDIDNPFDLCLKGEIRSHLAAMIGQLNEREQLILSLYYREELTMKEISKVVGVALSRVSQIREAAIGKLRKMLAHVEESKLPTREPAAPSQPAIDQSPQFA